MAYRISGTSISLHPEWRYDLNRKRNRFKGFDRDPIPLDPATTNRIRAELFDWPILGPIMKDQYMMRKADQYLADHGMTWADVDPMKMNQIYGSRTSTAMYVSKNIMRLYR